MTANYKLSCWGIPGNLDIRDLLLKSTLSKQEPNMHILLFVNTVFMCVCPDAGSGAKPDSVLL